jgi:hypothetical protein
MQQILASVWKFLVIAVIFLIVRSPIMMGIVGFTSGILVYHFYPEQVDGILYEVQNQTIEWIGLDLDNSQLSCGGGNVSTRTEQTN